MRPAVSTEPVGRGGATWLPYAHADAKSVVTFALTPTPGGTQLHMEQVGFRPEQKQAYGGARAGWQQIFAKLEQVLARAE